MMNLSHKQKIERAHIALMRDKDWVWLAPTCMIGKVEIRDDIPTAATNGRDVFYGAKFLDMQKTDAQVRGLVVHENMHKALLHLTIHQNLVQKYVPKFGLEQARMLVNMAQDYVINRSIVKGAPFLEMPGGVQGCYDAKYDDEFVWDTIKIAEDLASQAKSGGGKGGKGQPGSGDSMDHHDWDGAEQLTAEEKEELASQISQALRQGEVLSKKMSGNVPREVGHLLTPAVDWRQALRDFVTERAKGDEFQTFARPNKRFLSHGVYMPTSYSETVECLAFLVDTSGSIGPEDLREVLSEVAGCIEIVKPKRVDVIYWDTAVARHEHYEGDDVFSIMQSTKPAGGGGTAPSCVVPFCHSRGIKPNVAIWLSDGYVGDDWAEGLGCPALWIISSNGVQPSHLPSVKLPSRN